MLAAGVIRNPPIPPTQRGVSMAGSAPFRKCFFFYGLPDDLAENGREWQRMADIQVILGSFGGDGIACFSVNRIRINDLLSIIRDRPLFSAS